LWRCSGCSTSTEKLADDAFEGWPAPAPPRKNLFNGHEHGESSWRLHCPCAQTRRARPRRFVGCNNGDAEKRLKKSQSASGLVDALAHRAQAAPLCSVHRTGSFAAGGGRRRLGGMSRSSGVAASDGFRRRVDQPPGGHSRSSDRSGHPDGSTRHDDNSNR
jgi:hypothetical protein